MTDDAATAAPTPAPGPATGAEKSVWVAMALALLLILEYHLLSSLLAGLLVYALIHRLGRRLEGKSMSHHMAKLAALSIIAAVIIGVCSALILLAAGFLHGKFGHLGALLDHMAGILETARDRYGWQWIPAAENLKTVLAHALREHSGELQKTAARSAGLLVHALVGVVIGAIAAFETARPTRPLAVALQERMSRLLQAFERVVFAQLRISLLNTVFTAIYLLVALPLFHVDLPLRKTLVVITFVAGLIPVLGNLLSNTAIVIVSLGTSMPVAFSSLIYLVVIHKLEYFLNARIVGREIRAAAWEILVAMILFEAVFGIAGVIAAPILYAYAKRELTDRGLI